MTKNKAAKIGSQIEIFGFTDNAKAAKTIEKMLAQLGKLEEAKKKKQQEKTK